MNSGGLSRETETEENGALQRSSLATLFTKYDINLPYDTFHSTLVLVESYKHNFSFQNYNLIIVMNDSQ